MIKSTTLQNRHYTYFNSGDIDTVTDNLTGVTYDYTYNDLHRLTDETNTGGFGAMHVTYDAIGNITQKSVGPNTFNLFYDASHKHAVDYVRYNGTNYDYTYDANGNMTQGYDFSNLSTIRTRTITYNVDNMPTSIVHGSGTTAALLYDGAGARAKKTVTGGTPSTTYYIGEHFEVKNGVATKYFFAGNLRIAQMVGSTVSYFHKDHLGSSTVMTDSSGVLLESTNFEPFGGQRAHTGTDTSAYKFTDQEFDAENGLYNYDARMYDPIIGRFISPDNVIPNAFNPQSLNRYSYCRNNPLIYSDPTGHIEYMMPENVCVGWYYFSNWRDPFGDPFFMYSQNTWGQSWGLVAGAFCSQFIFGGGGGDSAGILSQQADNALRNSKLTAQERADFKTAVNNACKGKTVDPDLIIGVAFMESSLDPKNSLGDARGMFGIRPGRQSDLGLTDAEVKSLTGSVDAVAGYFNSYIQKFTDWKGEFGFDLAIASWTLGVQKTLDIFNNAGGGQNGMDAVGNAALNDASNHCVSYYIDTVKSFL